jgi:diguanylate cyclase (GGDEF)-like protein
MRRAASLQKRLTGLLTLLILLVLSATLLAAFLVARDNVKQRTEDSVEIGYRVVERVLDDRVEQLASAASILVRDYGFVEAVATGDSATISSALSNHGERIGADMALSLSLEGNITGSTLASLPSGVPFPDAELLKKARREGYATSISLLDNTPYQLIVVPIEAPVQVAWACLGFRLNDSVAAELHELTGLGVHFAATTPGNTASMNLVASSLVDAPRRELAALLAMNTAIGGLSTVSLGDESNILRIDRVQDSSILLVLQTSLDAAMAPFHTLYIQLGVIAVLSLLAALVASWFVARSVARPLQRLADSARDIRDGRYDNIIVVRDGDGLEARTLADSLNHMREGIAAREERILHQSRHDPLTGLPNRGWAEEQLSMTIAGAGSVAVILINLNRFSEINDRFGHEHGDAVLIEVSRRLLFLAGNSGLAARTGGNEFLLALPLAADTDVKARVTQAFAALAVAIPIGSAEIHVSARAGIALAPQHGRDVTRLLRRADLALRDASAQLPQVTYTDGREEAHQRDLVLARDLVAAIANDRLTLNYQPKISVRTGALLGVEALARWTHPQHGFIRPDHFIAMAERNGQIGPLTRWVLRNAICQAALWQRSGLNLITSINLSALDLADRDLPDFIEQVLHEYALPPASVCLEVTESTAMQDTDMAIAALERLRALGVTTSIDDFGTGFSSLAQLRRLPLDELKIDKAFVLKLRADSNDAAIVRSTIDLAHNMKLKVTAEGVETAEALALLDDWGCDIAQGFLISKPLPADAFATWLQRYKPQTTQEHMP